LEIGNWKLEIWDGFQLLDLATRVTKKVDQRLEAVGPGGFKEYGMQFFHVVLPLLIFWYLSDSKLTNIFSTKNINLTY
jgi:hypothetical protein